MVDTVSIFKVFDKRRRKLDMTKTAVAKRAGVSLPTVNRLFKGDDRRPGVHQVHAIAEALGMDLRLGARQEVTEACNAVEFRMKQAETKARKLMRMVQGTMALEAQAVESDAIEQMVRETACKLMAGSGRRLWED